MTEVQAVPVVWALEVLHQACKSPAKSYVRKGDAAVALAMQAVWAAKQSEMPSDVVLKSAQTRVCTWGCF